MRKNDGAWIYRILLLLMVIGSLIILAIHGIPRSSDKRIGTFDLTEGKTKEEGIYFQVNSRAYQYKPAEDLLIELSGAEKTAVLRYMKEEKEKYESHENWDEYCKKFLGEEYCITKVIRYEECYLLTVYQMKQKENWFYKAYNMDEEPILLTEIVNAPSQAIARFEQKLYYVTDEIGLSNKFVCCDMDTGEITELKGYHHNYGMVELIVKEDCLYYTTSPYEYTDGGVMYFNFETKEHRFIYSNVK